MLHFSPLPMLNLSTPSLTLSLNIELPTSITQLIGS